MWIFWVSRYYTALQWNAWWYESMKIRSMLKIRGVILKLIHRLWCLCNLYTLTVCSFQPVSLYVSSEEHYHIVTQMSFHPESWPEWDCVWWGTDWCLVCWSMTVHIKVDTPSERVSTSARHVSAQEFRQCRETFSPTSKTFLCPYSAPYNFNLFILFYFIF